MGRPTIHEIADDDDENVIQIHSGQTRKSSQVNSLVIDDNSDEEDLNSFHPSVATSSPGSIGELADLDDDPDLTDCSANEDQTSPIKLTFEMTLPNCFPNENLNTFSQRSASQYFPKFSKYAKWSFFVKYSLDNKKPGLGVFLCVDPDVPPHWSIEIEATIACRIFDNATRTWKEPHSNTFGKEKPFVLSKLNVDQGFWGLIPSTSDVIKGVHGHDLHLVARITKFYEQCTVDSSNSFSSHALRTDVRYNGLVNQGATCYLNSLLQSLFHIGAFRRAVYQLPTEEVDDWKTSIPFALQRLFFRLQFSQTPVNTNELTTSFGWSADESFAQHDLHELLCVLMDRLEIKMKGTPADGAIPNLFSGKLTNYIKCINVDYTTERTESFNFLSLVVKGCKDIYESFRTYIEEETLDGSNQYSTEQFGLQDARKGIRFETLPPVLNLHLKRWELNPESHFPFKVNDHYQFYSILDLSQFLPPFGGTNTSSLPAESQHPSFIHNPDAIYHLHAVCVHSGETNSGHYYAFVRPTTNSQWFKFNDQVVNFASDFEATDANFGTPPRGIRNSFSPGAFYRSSNAYMLIYVREGEASRIMNDDCEDVIPSHLRKMHDEHLYAEFRVLTPSLCAQFHPNLFGLLPPRAQMPKFRLFRKTNILRTSAELIKQFPELGDDPSNVKLWYQKRDSFEYPPQCLQFPTVSLSPADYCKCDLEALLTANKYDWIFAHRVDKVSYCETYLVPSPMMSEERLLFFKFYDISRSSEISSPNSPLTFLGAKIVKLPNILTNSLFPIFLQLLVEANFLGLPPLPSDTEFLFYRESDYTSPHYTNKTFSQPLKLSSQVVNGDTIIFLPKPPPGNTNHILPPQFIEAVLNRIVVKLFSINELTERTKQVQYQLTRTASLASLTELIAKKLNCNATQIRLSTSFDIAAPHSIDSPQLSDNYASLTLSSLFPKKNSKGNTIDPTSGGILYPEYSLCYEQLPCTREEMTKMKRFHVALWPSSQSEPFLTTLIVPSDSSKASLFSQVCEDYIQKMSLWMKNSSAILPKRFKKTITADELIGKNTSFQFYDVSRHTISFASFHTPLSELSDMTSLCFQEVGQSPELLVPVIHFSRKTNFGSPICFGNPFFFPTLPRTTFGDILLNLRHFLAETEETFESW